MKYTIIFLCLFSSILNAIGVTIVNQYRIPVVVRLKGKEVATLDYKKAPNGNRIRLEFKSPEEIMEASKDIAIKAKDSVFWHTGIGKELAKAKNATLGAVIKILDTDNLVHFGYDTEVRNKK